MLINLTYIINDKESIKANKVFNWNLFSLITDYMLQGVSSHMNNEHVADEIKVNKNIRIECRYQGCTLIKCRLFIIMKFYKIVIIIMQGS